MAVVRRAAAWSVASSVALASVVALVPATAAAEGAGECHVVDVQLKPEARPDLSPGRNMPPQIVVWVEDLAGNYVDTIFITKQTGTYGLGNRPGRMDFNSGPFWPYGRRTTVFPVWAHKKTPLEYDIVKFQNADDSNLSHPFNQSSRDTHYCRPMQTTEPAFDALTCASPNGVFTDKGVLVTGGEKSLYPPRQDIMRAAGMDSASVDLYPAMNGFDAVSQATPAVGVPADISWPIPQDLAAGNYIMWVEVSKEFDHNTTYSAAAYPSPTGIPWSEYGEAYRGQPSIVFKVPFTIGQTETSASTNDYVGYSDPDGQDGNVRAPDGTITTNVQGSGVGRLGLIDDGQGGSYRVRVTARPEFDSATPGAAAEMAVDTSRSREALVTFVAPGDDGSIGKVSGYEIRYRIGDDVTATNFDDVASTDPKLALTVGDPGTLQTFTLDRLLPETEYSVGIRAFDDCHNKGALTTVRFTTPERAVGEVDACFVATAAYGSVLAADVTMLRHLRDAVLRKSVLGELAVQTYYTFSPAVATLVGESELLRSTARELLLPIVRVVRAFTI